jgi:hypothetical protein
MEVPSTCRHRKKKNVFDTLLPPGFCDSLASAVPLLPDTWGRITSNRTHRVSKTSVNFLAAKHGLSPDTIRQMLRKLP